MTQNMIKNAAVAAANRVIIAVLIAVAAVLVPSTMVALVQHGLLAALTSFTGSVQQLTLGLMAGWL